MEKNIREERKNKKRRISKINKINKIEKKLLFSSRNRKK